MTQAIGIEDLVIGRRYSVTYDLDGSPDGNTIVGAYLGRAGRFGNGLQFRFANGDVQTVWERTIDTVELN